MGHRHAPVRLFRGAWTCCNCISWGRILLSAATTLSGKNPCKTGHLHHKGFCLSCPTAPCFPQGVQPWVVLMVVHGRSDAGTSPIICADDEVGYKSTLGWQPLQWAQVTARRAFYFFQPVIYLLHREVTRDLDFSQGI